MKYSIFLLKLQNFKIVIIVMADEDGEEEFDKLDHIINSSGCAKELELSKGNFSAINRVRETTSDRRSSELRTSPP